jgi:hypothetical protein
MGVSGSALNTHISSKSQSLLSLLLFFSKEGWSYCLLANLSLSISIFELWNWKSAIVLPLKYYDAFEKNKIKFVV